MNTTLPMILQKFHSKSVFSIINKLNSYVSPLFFIWLFAMLLEPLTFFHVLAKFMLWCTHKYIHGQDEMSLKWQNWGKDQSKMTHKIILFKCLGSVTFIKEILLFSKHTLFRSNCYKESSILNECFYSSKKPGNIVLLFPQKEITLLGSVS